MPKMFVSIPMRGYSNDAIRTEMEAVKTWFENYSGEEFELIDTLNHDNLLDMTKESDEDLNYCYWLGRSIQRLAEADICVFHPQWREAPGCIIEHMICALYGIPYAEITSGEEEDLADEIIEPDE